MEEKKEIFRERKRWTFFGLPFTFTVYTIKEEEVPRREDCLNLKEDDCYLYKIQDVQLRQTFFGRLFGLGSVICYTSDTTDPMLQLKNIRHSDEIKRYIFEASEKARLKRRTINTLNLNPDIGDVDI